LLIFSKKVITQGEYQLQALFLEKNNFMKNPFDDWLTTSEFAKAVGAGGSAWIMWYIKNDLIEHQRVGRYYYIHKNMIGEWDSIPHQQGRKRK
jgi:hypothetical protein